MRSHDEPWADDFSALERATLSDVPSIERTKEFVLASAKPTPDTRKERLMNAMNRRPLLAGAIALVVLAVLSPVAYAVVNKYFLSIDPDQSESEIEADVAEQLAGAGLTPERVTAEKSGDQLKLEIEVDPSHGALSADDLAVSVRGKHAPLGQWRVSFADLGETSAAVIEVMKSDAVLALVKRSGEQSQADLARSIEALLVERGIRNVSASVEGSAIVLGRSPKR
jgi:hypothetical protein